MLKNFIIVITFASPILAQMESKVTANIFQKNYKSLILNSNQNGTYKDYLSQSNLTFKHIYDNQNSKFSVDIMWFFNNETIDILKFNLKFTNKFGNTNLGLFSQEKIYQSSIFSTGSMVFSENTFIPGIGYNTSWFNIKNLFDIKGVLFQGKFPSQTNYSEGPYLHYKSLLFKKQYNKTKLGLQIQHAVQFGGVDQNGNKIPVNPKIFLRMISAQSGDSSQPEQDQVYKIGNGLGSYIFNVKHQFYQFDLNFYFEHYFDDKSGVKMKNFGDGLFGIEIISSNFKLLLEKLDTTNQSGDTHPPGVDSYYWHGVYNFGWSNDSLSLGNTFLDPFNNRKIINNLGVEYTYKSIKVLFRGLDSKEYIPYLDKNNNKPYEDINNLIHRKKYHYIGLEVDLKNNNKVKILFSDDHSARNIKLSYSISF